LAFFTGFVTVLPAGALGVAVLLGVVVVVVLLV
jgi:hypothetical protein